MFFELIFIIWILRSYYLWKKKIEYESNKGFTVKGFYKSKEREKKEIIDRRNNEKETITYGELKNILIEVKNLQCDAFKNYINELKEISFGTRVSNNKRH